MRISLLNPTLRGLSQPGSEPSPRQPWFNPHSKPLTPCLYLFSSDRRSALLGCVCPVVHAVTTRGLSQPRWLSITDRPAHENE